MRSRLSRALACGLVCGLFCSLVPAQQLRAAPAAESEHSIASNLRLANDALDGGDFGRAQVTVQIVLDLGPQATVEQRQEAFRILALSHFYQDNEEDAREIFLEFLRLDPDAHLDPAMAPPEAITLLEDCRVSNAAELEAYRKKPKKKRYVLLNLVPAGGQLQNGERVKSIVLASGMGTLLVANLTSYIFLKSYCSEVDRTCTSNGADKTKTANTLQTLNLLSGVGLGALYAYSVIDGYLGYRRLERRDRLQANDMSFAVLPTKQGTSFALSLSF